MESVEGNKEVNIDKINEEAEQLRIEELFKNGDFAYLYQYFLRQGDGNTRGLRRVAEGLREEGKEKDAKAVEKKIQSLEEQQRLEHRA